MRTAVALVLASALAFLGLPQHAIAQPATAPAAQGSAEASLRWGDCEGENLGRAQCSYLTVPRDWARSHSGTYKIAVARIPAEVAPTRGVLIFNPGGPGSAGLASLDFIQRKLPQSIRDSFDVVTFDPRGVGASQPRMALCRTNEPDVPATGPVDWLAVTSASMASSATDAVDCLEANAAHADLIGSWQVVRDIDALRRALGSQQITFWGMSYGTTLGRAYAQTFPQRLRALVLDGTITPKPSIGDYAREHIWDDVTAVQTMLGAFGAGTKRSYREVMTYLDKKTLSTADGQLVTRWLVSSALITKAAYQSQWPEAKQILKEVRNAIRDTRALTRTQFARLRLDVPVMRTDGMASPAAAFVNCADMHDRPSAQVVAGAAEQAARVGGTTFGLTALMEGAQCAGVPRLGRPIPPLMGTLRLPTPPVIVNSVADNRTPWLGARATANAFTGSSMVTYAGTQHVTYAGPSDCVNAAVTPYLLNRTLPARSVACPLALP